MARRRVAGDDSRRVPLTKHSIKNLMRRLSQAGFAGDFVRPAILPDWWDEGCSQDTGLLPDIEIRVARFLGLPLAAVRDPQVRLEPKDSPIAQLRRIRDIDRDRLAPAIHSAVQVASAVARNLKNADSEPRLPPADGLAWREQFHRKQAGLTLDDVLGDLWGRGIPVVSLDILPSPRFQGAACVVEGRPVVLLGHQHDAPGRVAFIVTHEAGHIAGGDCTPEQLVVDQEDEILDDSDMERRADRFATRALVGGDTVPSVDGADYKQIARRAAEIEREGGADASMIIFAWAAKTGEYAKASMSVKALYRASGARRLLRRHFDLHVDLESAPESDRSLLRCIQGDPDRDATSD